MTLRASAGGALLHPVALLAVAALAVNDHWLKDAWAHPATGKISDFAGLAFFPLLLVALIEVALAAVGRFRGPSDRTLILAVAATGIVFALIEVTAAGTLAYDYGLGSLQRPTEAVRAILDGGRAPRVASTADATDLFALVALVVPLLLGRSAARVGLAGSRTAQTAPNLIEASDISRSR